MSQDASLLDEFLTFVDENEELECTICCRVFSSIARKNEHVCKGARTSNDLLSVALRHAHSLIREGKVDFIDTRARGTVSSTESSGEGQFVKDFFEHSIIEFSPVQFNEGWAIRAAHGKAYGAKYIERYKDDIDAMFAKGCEDQRNKIGPGRMLETLRLKFPDRLDLPSETEIRQRITALTAKYKKHGTIFVKKGIQEPFKTLLRGIVESSNFTIKPKDALVSFKTKAVEHSGSEDYPTDSKVKSFISALKAKHRKSQTNA